MAAKGGDIREVTFTHPTIGSGAFFPKANEGNKLDPGGIRTSDDASMIDGSGEPIWQMNFVRGGFEILIANDMNNRNDIAKVALLAGDPVDSEWTVALLNGTVWSGTGRPVGEISADVNVATLPIKIASGNFTKIVG